MSESAVSRDRTSWRHILSTHASCMMLISPSLRNVVNTLKKKEEVKRIIERKRWRWWVQCTGPSKNTRHFKWFKIKTNIPWNQFPVLYERRSKLWEKGGLFSQYSQYGKMDLVSTGLVIWIEPIMLGAGDGSSLKIWNKVPEPSVRAKLLGLVDIEMLGAGDGNNLEADDTVLERNTSDLGMSDAGEGKNLNSDGRS